MTRGAACYMQLSQDILTYPGLSELSHHAVLLILFLVLINSLYSIRYIIINGPGWVIGLRGPGLEQVEGSESRDYCKPSLHGPGSRCTLDGTKTAVSDGHDP